MINHYYGDLLQVTHGFIVHGCNARGVMGAGVAKSIKAKWPFVFDAYIDSLRALEDPLGSYSKVGVSKDLFVVNMIAQERYVNYAAVALGFRTLFDEIEKSGSILPVHFPLIGAGLGGGDWNIIEQIIQDADPYDKIVKNLWIL